MMFKTKLTELTNAKYPIIAGPMFLVSDETLVVAACRAGIIGGFPSLNWRTTEEFEVAVKNIKEKVGDLPFAVNIIVNKAMPRIAKDLEVCIRQRVPIIITSLGNPKEVIEQAHRVGTKVFCDVTNLGFAEKVQALGADAVIAVSQGAGGHAGPISPMVLVPYLQKNLKIPVIAAGGVATGRGLAAALTLGASGVQIGTRFIASTECKVDAGYKNAIVNAKPEDIVLTLRISGTPAAVIKTPYIEKVGLDLNPIEKLLLKNSRTKHWYKLLISLRGMSSLKNAAEKTTWKEVWSAGQGVGLIDEIKPIQKIVDEMIKEAVDTVQGLARS